MLGFLLHSAYLSPSFPPSPHVHISLTHPRVPSLAARGVRPSSAPRPPPPPTQLTWSGLRTFSPSDQPFVASIQIFKFSLILPYFLSASKIECLKCGAREFLIGGISSLLSIFRLTRHGRLGKKKGKKKSEEGNASMENGSGMIFTIKRSAPVAGAEGVQ